MPLLCLLNFGRGSVKAILAIRSPSVTCGFGRETRPCGASGRVRGNLCRSPVVVPAPGRGAGSTLPAPPGTPRLHDCGPCCYCRRCCCYRSLRPCWCCCRCYRCRGRGSLRPLLLLFLLPLLLLLSSLLAMCLGGSENTHLVNKALLFSFSRFLISRPE